MRSQHLCASSMRFFSSSRLARRVRIWSEFTRGQCRAKLSCRMNTASLSPVRKCPRRRGCARRKQGSICHPLPEALRQGRVLSRRARLHGQRQRTYLPVPLEGAEVADAHAARPAVLRGWAPAHLTRDHQLRARLAVQPQPLELVQQEVFSSRSLDRGTRHKPHLCSALSGRKALLRRQHRRPQSCRASHHAARVVSRLQLIPHMPASANCCASSLPWLQRRGRSGTAAPAPMYHTLRASVGPTRPGMRLGSAQMQPHRHPCPGDAPLRGAERPATSKSCICLGAAMTTAADGRTQLTWQSSLALRPYRLDVCCRCAALQPQQPVLGISVDVVDLMWASQMSHQRAPMQLDQQMTAGVPEPRDQHCRRVQAWLARSQMPCVPSASFIRQAASASGRSISLQGHLTVTYNRVMHKAQVELAA